MILLIDNYDSFVHNLARYFQRLGQRTVVVRNDQIDVSGIRQLDPRAIVLSPGPRTPCDAGCCLETVEQLWRDIPVLGVCLGHQAIAEAFGGRIVRAREPVHGRSSLVRHDGKSVFADVPNPCRAGRYHSLIVDGQRVPACLKVTARTADGIIMALEHRDRPVFGWQFHPESVLTEHGYTMLAAFIRQAGLPVDPQPLRDELPPSLLPDGPTWFQQPAASWGVS